MPRDHVLPATRYGRPAQGFHWLTAAIVLGMIGVGLWMVGLPIGRQKLVVYGWHKWFGLLLLVITLARLVWRHFHAPPPLPAGITAWERRAAPIAHWALYGLLIAMPITGWLMTSAAGLPVIWFGLFEVPDLVDRDPALLEAFKSAHHWLSRALILLLLVHVAAVIRHDVLRRDGIIRRMWPFAR
jgi:cytochrome b561